MIFKKTKEHQEALEIIRSYADHCPKCDSDNISYEDDTSLATCHNCSHQFSDSDYMDKFHIVALLNLKGLVVPAKDIQEMTVSEYDDFLINHIY